MVIEAGAHSPWVSRLLESIGHSVVVANARKVRLIYESDRKNDRLDARMLARLGRVDVELLAPVRHRGAQAQIELQCNLRILIHSTARFRNSTQSARVGAEL
jgi:transposase